MLKFKMSLLALALVSISAWSQDSYIVRFDLSDGMKKYLRSHEYDVTGVNYETNEIEALLTEEELAELRSQKSAVIKFSYPQNLSAAPDEEYKNPQEIEDFLVAIHAQFPDITSIHAIGKTLEGREILALKISDNPRVDEIEPVVLVNGMHHAREVMTPEITTDMIQVLTTYYGQNTEITEWVNGAEIWVIPMLNLDGNNKMWNQNSMWRKNTRNGHGVDLNRNYPTGWNSCNGSSASPNAQDYRGTAPASEPETQAMMDFVSTVKPVFNISYHSYSEIVIYPFGCRPQRTPTTAAVEAIGAEIGKQLNYKPGTAWELLYNADGGDIDWMYTAHQVIPFVIEVNSTSQGFHPDYKTWRDKTVLRNRPGWMHLFTRLSGPSLQGSVSSSEYHSIDISQAGSNKIAQNYKINQDGSFYIILEAGTYDFSFKGSKSKKIESVRIDKKVTLNL